MTQVGLDDADEVGYELDDWAPEQRQQLSAALDGDGVPHRWEGADLVVSVAHADLAEQLIDDLDHPDALPVEEDADDTGAEVLSTFYVAADVLVAAPDHPTAGADVLDASTRAATLPAPYGIEEPVWAEVRRRADELAAQLRDGPDEHEVAAAARRLREAVRPLV